MITALFFSIISSTLPLNSAAISGDASVENEEPSLALCGGRSLIDRTG